MAQKNEILRYKPNINKINTRSISCKLQNADERNEEDLNKQGGMLYCVCL